ncbi:MAG: hypothetical protein ACE5FJ_06545, partial [Gemmatimonadales bacterium]
MLRSFFEFGLIVALFTSQPSLGAAWRQEPYVLVLGIAQDGGVPQTGTIDHPGWDDDTEARSVVSLALVDPASGERWLFEATPDFPEQLHILDTQAPTHTRPGLDHRDRDNSSVSA